MGGWTEKVPGRTSQFKVLIPRALIWLEGETLWLCKRKSKEIHTQNVNVTSPLAKGNKQKWFEKKVPESGRMNLNFSFLNEDRGPPFSDLWVCKIAGEVKRRTRE